MGKLLSGSELNFSNVEFFSGHPTQDLPKRCLSAMYLTLGRCQFLGGKLQNNCSPVSHEEIWYYYYYYYCCCYYYYYNHAIVHKVHTEVLKKVNEKRTALAPIVKHIMHSIREMSQEQPSSVFLLSCFPWPVDVEMRLLVHCLNVVLSRPHM